MANYIPVQQHIDRMPVDISFVFKDEMPAGKHGFCQRKGDRFVFEDGTVAKFFGVICNGASCFPDHDHAEKVANRLMQTGVNYVRFHQLDSEWCAPNFYRLTSGKRVESTREFCPESMERLDYWIKCLKERGIYATIDMCTYRKFKSGDGVKHAVDLAQNPKVYAHYDPVLIDLQKEFCTKFWNHFNPYTGLKYKDDPFFFGCIISNENETFNACKNSAEYGKRVPYYDNEFRDMFAQWLEEQGEDKQWAYDCTLFDTEDIKQGNFRTVLEQRYAQTMYDHIRSLGVKIPICDTNWKKANGLIKAQENMDFNAGNCYYYDWNWGEYEKTGWNNHITENPIACLGGVCSMRRADHPMHITEWDMPWPNSYRAEGAVWFPAMVALQDWVGMSIHTYCYTPHIQDTDLLGKEAITNGVGNVPYREGIFTVWNDPAKYGLFYHGALMVRRQDVSPAKKTVGNLVDLSNPSKIVNTLATTAMEIHKVVSVFDESDKEKYGLDEVLPDSTRYPREDPNIIMSDTGEVWRDLKKKVGVVDTPRTKIAYGMLNGAAKAANTLGPYDLPIKGLKVACHTDFGVVALSSLNDKPICESDNLLLTTVGRACNTNQQFDGEKFLSYGQLPIQMEVIDADIEIETSVPDLQVWSINSEGSYAGRIKCHYEDGKLKFHVGPHFPCQYYLIMQE